MPRATPSRHVQGANLFACTIVNNTGSMSDTKLWCPRYGRGTVRCAIICVHTDVETCVVTGELVCDIFGSSLQYTSVDDHYTCYRGGEASLTSWTHHTTHMAILKVGAVVVNLYLILRLHACRYM